MHKNNIKSYRLSNKFVKPDVNPNEPAIFKANAIIKAKKRFELGELTESEVVKIKKEKDDRLKLKKMREDEEESCNSKTLVGYFCMIVLFVTLALLVLSFQEIHMAYTDKRNMKMKEYMNAEYNWNRTHLNEIKGLNISYIQDYNKYIELQVQIDLQKFNHTEVQNLRQQQERILSPLHKMHEDVANISEKHLLNFFDEIGDFPEYEPYSLQVENINPVPFLIANETIKRQEDLTNQQTIYLEI
jgi:hypothetical protein